MDYIGIDVGVGKFHLTSYAQNKEVIENRFFRSCEDVCDFLNNKKVLIAIDAPSGTKIAETERRRCEQMLGIGGYFSTPFDFTSAEPWMISGFELWKILQKKGFERANSYPTKYRQLIEVHPTIIFKKLMNPGSSPKSWIRKRKPVSKKKLEGRRQRKELLGSKFPGHIETINNLRIDYLDALIAAYTAEYSHEGKVEVFGDPHEGQIWFPSS
jgi:predicted nuclease with RNAse H fold